MTVSDTGRTIFFGILCNSIELEAWQVDSLEALVRVPGCVPIVTVLNVTSSAPTTFFQRLVRLISQGRLGWTVFNWLVASRPSPATRKVNPPEWLRELQQMKCAVVKEGRYSEYFADSDVERLRAMNLDFLIKFGFGITRGAILTAAKYGVWSFHHDDERQYRGAPPCFWEIYDKTVVTGSILQRLTETLDCGVVLKRGYFQTILHSYVKNRDQAFVASTVWPAQVCCDILKGEADYLADEAEPPSAPIYRYPRNFEIALFCLRLSRNWIMIQFEELFFCDVWNVGVADEPLDKIVRRGSIGHIRWFDPLGGDRYVADPSGVTIAGANWIFAEDYTYTRNRGVIVARQLFGGTANEKWRTVIDSPYHLSFPQILAHKGRFYCLPECAQSREVALYSTDSFPEGWAKIATLVPNFPGVDPTLFFHECRWWLFCTDFDHGDRSHLHIFYSDSLTGPYTPHINNPVKMDIRSSRPAGPLFQMDGAWVRPAQNDAKTYGHSITFNRILRLTPEVFEEEFLSELLPDPDGPFPNGLHTIQGLGELTLIDGKCRRFVPHIFLRRLIGKVSKLISGRSVWKLRSE